MIYRNKIDGTLKLIPESFTDLIDRLTYEKLDVIEADALLNKDYITSMSPKDEFTELELHELSNFRSINKPYLHIKSGNKYYLLYLCVECTNGQEDQLKVIYCNQYGSMFTREITEFFKKFSKCNP